MNKYTARVAELGGKWIFKNELPIHLTEAELTAFEQKLGYTLPNDYREFLRDFGGYNFNAFYPLPGGPKYLDSGDLGLMLGIMNSSYDLWQQYQSALITVSIIPEILPIAVSNTEMICLILTGPKSGQVHHWANENYCEPFDYSNLYFIANSFDEFMQILVRYED